MSEAPAAAGYEAALVARACSGEVAAFEQLYQRAGGRIFALCLRMSGDRARAAELTHEAFVRAWERLAQYRGESAFTTWMHRLAVNLVLERLRSDRRREARVTLVDDEATDHAVQAAFDPAASDILDRVDLERAVAALPPNARQVFVLHDVEGYRHEEIAERMHLAPGTVRAHLHRARKLLMGMLQR
jgi:RNA polymerase sigma-70 factor (ECF subfamily)